MDINKVNSKPRPKPAPVGCIKSTTCSEPRELLHAVGYVNNVKASMILDSGAACSAVSAKMLDSYCLKLSEETREITLADDSKIEAPLTESVNINLHGNSAELNLVVLDNDSKPILLGLDWLIPAEAIIDFKERTLIFSRRSIILDTGDDFDISANNAELNNCSVSVDDYEDIQIDELWELEKNNNNVKHTSVKEEIAQITTTIMDKGELELDNANQLAQVLFKEKDLFAESLDDLGQGATNVPEFEIITTSPKPIYQPPYRKSERERTILNKEVDKMLQAGIIRKSSSPWSAP